MADIEKVIKGLEYCTRPTFDPCMTKECPYVPNGTQNFSGCQLNLMADAIELLKEQDRLLHKKQKDIDKLCADISDLRHRFHEKTEIVRCCKCRKRETIRCPVYTHKRVSDKWYCADGERRDSSC